MKVEYDSEYFPKKLRKIKNYPKRIYVLGNLKILNNFGIAIIGSRNCSTYGEKMAKLFAKKLSKYKINIISGMAIGIDKYAHVSAIEKNGSTIAVLPSGFNKIYPKENEYIVDKIIKSGGAVISEYEPDEVVKSKNFIERNRIVSALSDGILIIEGGYRSGTSVTARIGKEQNKKIFCVPSSLENPKGIVPNKLIHEGAILVRNEEDIIENYNDIEKIENKNYEKTNYSNEKEFSIMKFLDEEIIIDEIVKKSNLKIEEVNYQLTMLQLMNKVEQLPGKRYRRII